MTSIFTFLHRQSNPLPYLLSRAILPCAALVSCSVPSMPPTPLPEQQAYSAPHIIRDERTVTIESGAIEGILAGNVLSFKGIPYAAPPLGDRRWRAPEPPAAWTAVRKTTAFAHDCMQMVEQKAGISADTSPSEDCLVLNIWRPAEFTGEKPFPVLLWIHGGAYITGGSSNPLYDGSAFAHRGIVFVSVNYRLGRFGFFAHPALISAAEGPVGNYAYMDLLAALKWIQRNIAAFEGDPNQVTLAGESAGGDAVLHLLTSPRAKGLFQRAVVMSGGGRVPLLGDIPLTGGTARQPSADQIGVNFALTTGITGLGPDALHGLRNLPADRIKGNLSFTHLIDTSSKLPTYVKGAIVDGTIVSGSPGDLFSRRQVTAMPLLIGTTCRELSITVPPSKDLPLAYFGSNARRARAAYARDSLIQPDELYAAISMDATMQEPARFAAGQNLQAGKPTWLYRFCYAAQSVRAKGLPARHGSELAFAFDRLVVRYGEEATDADRAMAKAFNTYLANFVKSGDPNDLNLPTWPVFNPVTSELMIFTQHHGPITMPDPWKERLDLIMEAADGNRARSEIRR